MGLASKLQAAQAGAPGGGFGGPPGGVPLPSAPPFPGGAPAGYPSQGQSLYGAPPSQYGQPSGSPGLQPGQQGFNGPGQQQQQVGQYGSKPPYEALGSQRPAGQYGQPQQGSYGQPQQGQFGQSQQGQFGQPQPGQFGQPQQGQYGQPQQGQFGQSSSAPGQYGGQPGMPQGHGAPAGAAPVGQFGGQGTFDANTIRNKLVQTIQTNRLQAFYPPQVLEQVVQRVASTDLMGFGARWRLPKEITLDLVALALYDIVLYCDDSGSMAFEESGERIDDLKMILGRVADAATLFDQNGINVRFMNSPVEGNNLRSSAEAASLLAQVKFSGTTPLGTSLDRKVLQPLVIGPARSNQYPKPTLVIAITDGEPSGEPKDAVRQVIVNAKRFFESTQFGPGSVAFQFAQVGKDTGAQAFLASLDTDPQVGKQIDCTSYYENESEEFRRKGIDLTPELWLVKLLVGSVDPSYDEQDEQ